MIQFLQSEQQESMSLRYFDPLSLRETFLDVMPRQAEDEPDYLKELLAQAGIAGPIAFR